MKKRLSLLTTLLAIGACVPILFKRPAIPENWNRIDVGHSQEDVRAIEPRLDLSIREVKGFDQLHEASWSLFVFYDEDAEVSSVSMQYHSPLRSLLDHNILLGDRYP